MKRAMIRGVMTSPKMNCLLVRLRRTSQLAIFQAFRMLRTSLSYLNENVVERRTADSQFTQFQVGRQALHKLHWLNSFSQDAPEAAVVQLFPAFTRPLSNGRLLS